MVFPDASRWAGEPRPWRRSAVVAVLLGVPFGFAVRVLVGAAWAACGIGDEATSGTPVSLVLLTLACTLLAVGAITVVLALAGPRHPVLAASVTMLAMALVLWLVLALVATPAGRPDPVCHGNVPPWIPGWLPV